MTSADGRTILTEEGRKRLVERARRLREETVPSLTTAVEEDHEDVSLRLEHQMAVQELEKLEHIIATAHGMDEIPEDPDVVQIGDWVSIATEDGDRDRHLIVHPAEAALDTDRISSESPLARAVLGRRVGDEVRVEAPGGGYRCTITEVLRERPGDGNPS